jgi:hypothetical protein
MHRPTHLRLPREVEAELRGKLLLTGIFFFSFYHIWKA